MKGTITQIDPLKISRTEGCYQRVYFQMEDGSWAKTDLCPTYRNFLRWKSKLKVGVTLVGLKMKSKITVDADSWPITYEM